MKKTILLFAVALFAFQGAAAQTTREANPADVASVDAIMKAVYDVISGDAGQKRDWDRFRSLFYKDARLIPTSSQKNPNTGLYGAIALTPDDFAKRFENATAKEGFFEREIARRSDRYGNVVHVFSTYESLRKLSDKKPFARGINSFQLLFDGKRWWVVTIFWQSETAEFPIPKAYLKSKK